MNRLRNRKVLLIVAGGLLLVCIICGVIGTLSGDRETPEPSASEPTATAVAALATEESTAAPAPTATTQPVGTAVTIRARDELGEPLPGGMVNVWDDYESRSEVVAKCEDGEPVTMLERSGDGVLIETAGGARGWLTYWFISELYTPPAPEPTATPEPAPVVPFYGVGDVVEIEQHTITLNSAEVTAGVLAANFTVENGGNEQIIVSSLLSFTAKDSEGTKLDMAIFDCPTGQLDGTVLAGDKLRGHICWEAPTGGTLRIYYQPNLFGGTAVVWQIEQ